MPQSPKNKNREIPPHYQRLEGSELRPAPNAKFLGPADPNETIRVTLALRRRPDGPPVPDFDYFAKVPPAHRPRLSQEEFAAKYGAAPDDIARTEGFAREHGLTVVEAHPARRTMVLSGTVTQIEEAFGVSLALYEHTVVTGRRRQAQTETYRGLDGFVHIPSDLAPIIVAVMGLDNRRITKRNAGGDPPNTNPISVPEVTKLYNFPNNSAAGQTIAIFSEEGYQSSDIVTYYNTQLPAGYTVPTITDVSVDSSNSGFDPDGETTQDISISSSAAPGAAVAVYFTSYSQTGWFDLVHRVVHPNIGDPVCSVLSSSFYVSNGDDPAGLANSGVSTSWLSAVTAAFQDAAIQNVTICIASGDTGTDSKVGDGHQHVQYPASDPWVLCCGGTTIGNVSGSTFEEWVWNDGSGASGGGVSKFFSKPSYQSTANVPVSLNGGNVGRGVPDVAANSSVASGYPITLHGLPARGDGTSAAAPLYAGMMAVLSAAIGSPVGFLNPLLYALGEAVCRDIDPLATNPAAGPLDNGFAGVPGYPARPGWDACTGWGVIDGRRMLAGLQHEPLIATAIASGGNFGNICVGSFVDELLTINNTGFGVLNISNIVSSSPDFAAPDVLSYPLIVNPGESIEVVIRFEPTSFGIKAGTITIISNDPGGPHVIPVTGDARAPRLGLVIADTGSFGHTCLGSFVDEPLILNNSGKCALTVTDITSSSGEFLVPEVLYYPLTIAAGDSLDVPIRFEPTSLGFKAATLTVLSNDPAGARTIAVSGLCQAPHLTLAIAAKGHFGKCCVGSYRDEPLILNNSGKCTLAVTGITSSSGDFIVPEVLHFPLTIAAGTSVPLPIRFEPTSFGPKSATITVISDDPAGPHKIHVNGEAPSGKLTVTGSPIFGGVKCCHREEKILSICNTGECNLHVSHVGFKHKRRAYRLINDPFPATIRPGASLNIVVQYRAIEKVARACELVIHCDDPHDPVKHIELIAYTIWDCCNECSCSCKEPRKECCSKEHHEDPCCDDDDEPEE